MLLKKQNFISPQTGQPVFVVSESSKHITESGETVALYYYSSGTYTADAGQAAGTAVIGQLSYSPILDSGGTKIATNNDKSLSFTCAALTTEKPFPWQVFEEYQDATGTNLLTQITSGFANGEYCVDYLRGTVYGVKTTTASSMTLVGYKRLASTSNVEIDHIDVGDIEIGGVEIKNGTDDTRAVVKTDGTDNALVVTLNTLPTVDVSSLVTGEAKIGDIGILANANASGTGGDYHLTADSNGYLKINLLTDSTTPTVLTGGSTTVTTPDTAVVLGTTLATKSIYIRAKSTNTTNIYVGDSAVSKTAPNQQIILAANDSITLDIANRVTVYIDADTSLEGVDYLAMS